MRPEFIEISDELFLKVGKMITERYGIKMTPDKKIMFQSRLQRRLHELDIISFDEYAKKLFNENGESAEFAILADFISTNKTEFFREIEHFYFLSETIVPEFLNKSKSNSIPELKFWSAGCSNGQEAYSIGIQLEEFKRLSGMPFNYSIMATDISGKMLRSAKEAIYPMSQVDQISMELKHRYFLKGKNINDQKVRVVKEIRERVRVAYMNLMDGSYPFDMHFDVVFLRNTLIYFDQATQLEVLIKITNCIKTGGYLLIGHSESLINLQLPLISVAPSVYMKTKVESL